MGAYNFNNIPQEKRLEFRQAYLNKKHDVLKSMMAEYEVRPEGCSTCNQNSADKEWLDYLFKLSDYEAWLQGLLY